MVKTMEIHAPELCDLVGTLSSTGTLGCHGMLNVRKTCALSNQCRQGQTSHTALTFSASRLEALVVS
jgi:hypothetical protein